MSTITVNAEALRQVLLALNGSAHRIRELQATRNLPAGLTGGEMNPIDVLIQDFIRAEAAEKTGPAQELIAMVDAAMVEMANISPPLKRSECERLINAAISVASQTGVQPAAIMPAFMGVAKRKLDDLLAQGWKIDGFSINKKTIGREPSIMRGLITVGGMVGWWRSPKEEHRYDVQAVERALRNTIQLTPAEIQSGHDRVRWAEGLIKQLPDDHDGRNSWPLNYGSDKDARQAEWARRNGKTLQPVIQHVPVDDTEGGAA